MANLMKPEGPVRDIAPQPAGAKEVQKKLGHRIRDLRMQKGWSQEQLAHESGLGRASMGAIERGEASIRLANLLRISRTLDIALWKLVKGIDDQPKSGLKICG
jgi:transcriptional regulator with XRE-family HTH domain